MNESPFLRLFLAVPFFQKSSHKSLADCVRPNSRFKTPEDVPTLKMHSLKVRDVFHQYATHGLHTPFLYPRITGGFNLRQHAIHNIHTMVACYITVYGTRQLIGWGGNWDEVQFHACSGGYAGYHRLTDRCKRHRANAKTPRRWLSSCCKMLNSISKNSIPATSVPVKMSLPSKLSFLANYLGNVATKNTPDF